MKVDSLLFLLYLVYAFSQQKHDVDINNSNDIDGLNVKYIGRAPKFQIFPRRIKDSERKAFIMFSFNSLDEIELVHTSGPPNKIPNFAADRNLKFIGPISTPNYTKISFAGNPTLFPSCNISINTYLYKLDKHVDITYGNLPIRIPKFAFKWEISIKNWPFKNINNQLKLTLDVNTPKSFKIWREERGYKNISTAVDAGLAKMLLNFPTYAIVDGMQENIWMDNSTDKMGFIFPHFADMLYDPIVSFDTALPDNVVVISGGNIVVNSLWVLVGFLLLY